MRAEDVNPEWVEVGAKATYEASDRGEPWEEAPEWIKRVRERHVRAALAAVAPLIAAQERERCARVAHQHGYDLANLDERNGAFSAAAAIRALGDAAFVVATVEPDGSIRMRHEGDV